MPLIVNRLWPLETRDSQKPGISVNRSSACPASLAPEEPSLYFNRFQLIHRSHVATAGRTRGSGAARRAVGFWVHACPLPSAELWKQGFQRLRPGRGDAPPLRASRLFSEAPERNSTRATITLSSFSLNAVERPLTLMIFNNLYAVCKIMGGHR